MTVLTLRFIAIRLADLKAVTWIRAIKKGHLSFKKIFAVIYKGDKKYY